MKSVFAVFLCLAFLSASSAEDSQFYVKKLEATYRNAKTLQATFLQEYSEGGRVTRAESGTAYFRRPGKMRWEYAAPEKNLFVVDGKFAWFYVPVDHTVSRVVAKESSDWRTPLALLAGEMKVSRVCAKVEFSPQQPKDASLVRLECTLQGTEKDARSGKPHDTAYFEIVKASGELARVTINSAGGLRMEMQFSNWKLNPPAEEAFFHFQPPKGVAIVDGDQLMAGPDTSPR
jgi:outer membrane lipoprotein carrier protein